MVYRLQYKSSVKKELRKLSRTDRMTIVHKIKLLKKEPRPEGSAKLKGSRDLFRIRHGDYRIIYQIQNNVLIIIIIRIGHRREIYKNL
ncbi:type II toxin-antitoxin system mRNA interferase toxin, RelE/StbE family [Candidatus Saccharibacteria bacterium]|nr:type II toxin-antitoxin system mRNA interferase toxin, RelE/StbE family [Candidatus Saccharibacteria bacterium]